MDEFLDTKGLACPLPVLKTRRLMKKMEPGKVLTVEATDPASVIDFNHFCNTTGNENRNIPKIVKKRIFLIECCMQPALLELK